jgi:hypothetical protein
MSSSGCATWDDVRTLMSGSEPNPSTPKDELLTALSDVEGMHREKAAPPPGPDDEREDADDPAAVPETRPQCSSSGRAKAAAPAGDDLSTGEAEVDAALDQLEAFAVEIGASSAGGSSTASAAPAEAAKASNATVPSDSLGDEQLRAASAEVETITSNPEDQPTEHAAVAVGHCNEPRGDRSSVKPVAADLPGDEQPKQEVPATAATARRKRLRFRIGRRSADEAEAEAGPADPAGAAEGEDSGATPVTPLDRRIYRAVDRVLDRINAPFAALNDRQRALVGWAAVTTLVVSILAMVLVPRILPHRDAITFLQEKRAQLDTPPPAQASDFPEAAD